MFKYILDVFWACMYAYADFINPYIILPCLILSLVILLSRSMFDFAEASENENDDI